MSTYFKNISRGITTTLKGMSLTLRHLWNARHSRQPFAMQDSSYFDLKTGIVTLQYPHQTLPVPDNGRYQLDCEIDDCIVCDKCAKICPVDCIDIEPIKSSEVISYTSDGSPVRLYAAKFDIDMAKCCFCGLCTTVCPTECLTMTNEYDFSVVDITQMNFGFSNLSAEQADKKRKLYEQFVAEKEALKKSQLPTVNSSQPALQQDNKPKPAFKPNFKPTIKTDVSTTVNIQQPIEESIDQPKPAFKPSFKPAVKTDVSTTVNMQEPVEDSVDQPKPVFKPSFKPVVKTNVSSTVNIQETVEDSVDKPKTAFKPSFKPVIKESNNQQNTVEEKEEVSEKKPAFKPSFKPKFTQAIKDNTEVSKNNDDATEIQGIL